MKVQLASDGANAPVLCQVQTQYLGAKCRRNDYHAATGCGAESPGALAPDTVTSTNGNARPAQTGRLGVLADAQSTTDSEAVGLYGDWGCESGGIAGGDSLPGSTASAGVAREL
jgi:hypothetical protein